MRILIHSNREELDRNLNPVDYKKLPALKTKWGGNLGNKLFLTAMDVYCHMDGIEYEYLTSTMSIDYINSNFDLILWPLANCFCASSEIIGYLNNYTERLIKYRVPVLALGAGAQADSYDDLNELADTIRIPASLFIDAVHSTGGIFGLKGYFTKELFKKLGYRNDVVTGCPSMYQMGRNLQITPPLIDNAMRIALNGDATSMKQYRKNQLYKKYPHTWFVDQGEFIHLLYGKMKFPIKVRDIRFMMAQYSRLGIEMLADGKIICIYDLPRLACHLKSLNLDLSFGQRIHGNILCTLLGIPAIVYTHDSRTKELADYFQIPTYEGKNQKIDLVNACQRANWNNFNNSFSQKYDQFEKLLMTYGMPPISSNKYNFLTDAEQYQMPPYANDFSQFSELLKCNILWINRD